MLLKKNLEPTDFADSDCRVTEWADFDGYNGVNGYRIWVCKCGGGWWFQRHEWTRENQNMTVLEDWILYGYYPRKSWDANMIPAPDISDI